jgi:hypothetical protein
LKKWREAVPALADVCFNGTNTGLGFVERMMKVVVTVFLLVRHRREFVGEFDECGSSFHFISIFSPVFVTVLLHCLFH